MGDGPGKGSSSSSQALASWASAAALPFSLVGFKIQQSTASLPERCNTTLPTTDRGPHTSPYTPQQDHSRGQREHRDKRDKDSKSGNGSSGPTRDDKS